MIIREITSQESSQGTLMPVVSTLGLTELSYAAAFTHKGKEKILARSKGTDNLLSSIRNPVEKQWQKIAFSLSADNRNTSIAEKG